MNSLALMRALVSQTENRGENIMGKQVLLIKGSPRKNGNTSVMATRKIDKIIAGYVLQWNGGLR